ncbi:hypothetical protein [Synechococcus sp. CS-1328]|uniref:hypothetical protein n=1 Tax=Synechococcus sp. CS-1328 TaxID=2847976 RepID=UPI002880331F|nr:hypothetical protein [Synechococcus sp. CS-1328]
MLATLGGSLALLLGLAVLLLPLLAQELSRPRDTVWGAVVLLLGLVLVTSADRLVGAPMVAVLCGGLLIGRLGSEVGQARWRQLTPEEQQRLWSLERWRTSLEQLLVAVGKLLELATGLATGLASWIQERRQPRSVTKRWVRQEPAATDSSEVSSDPETTVAASLEAAGGEAAAGNPEPASERQPPLEVQSEPGTDREALAETGSNPGDQLEPGSDSLSSLESAPQQSPEPERSSPLRTAPRDEAETLPAGTAAAPSPAPEDGLNPSELTQQDSEPQTPASVPEAASVPETAWVPEPASVQDQSSIQAPAEPAAEAGPEAPEAEAEAREGEVGESESGSAPVVRSFDDVDALLRSTPEAP